MENNAALLERVRNGDERAKDIMVEQNMGLVYSIVKRFSGRTYETEDLVQIGAIGLIKAVKNFKSEFNVQFSTYAVPMIAGEIKRFMRDDGVIKISRTLKESAMKGWRAEESLRYRLNREPTINEISEECGVDVETLIEAFEAAAPPESIYADAYNNGDKEIKVLDTIEGERIEDNVINKVLIDDILRNLKPREKQVLILRYFKGKTQTEISKMLGVSQVQISRIEKKAIEKIRVKEDDD
ncbi:MAG: SigB/SigF/SigG family RNA polymerase sigma factor, partial [Oscillospiraceae bacterium]|nr:SigB/SigF/SigG family RNA polymerase sigma factor [Oscillospiraceae bacterium]